MLFKSFIYNLHNPDTMTNYLIKITFMAAAMLSVLAANAQTVFSPANSNVSYADVTRLDYASPDHQFSYGDDDLQFGRLWLTKTELLKERSIVLIHGGCWLNQFDMLHTFPLATALAQAGYNVWSLEYRRTGDIGGGWPGSFDDIKAGIQYISQLSEYQMTMENTVIVGHSAGGHLAVLAGQEFPNSKAVVGLAAITNLTSYSAGSSSCELATASFMGGTFQELPSHYKAANPAGSLLHSNTLLLHGSSDAIVGIEQSALENSESEILQGAGHFDWVHPGTEAFTLLLNSLEALF